MTPPILMIITYDDSPHDRDRDRVTVRVTVIPTDSEPIQNRLRIKSGPTQDRLEDQLIIFISSIFFLETFNVA